MNYTPERGKIEQGAFLIYQGSGMITFYQGGQNSTPDFHQDFARSVTDGCVLWARPESGRRHPRGPRGEMVPI